MPDEPATLTPKPRTARLPATWSFACALALATPGLVASQETPPDLGVEPLWSTEQFLSGRAPLGFELSRPLDAPDERLAIVVGTVDVSALLQVRGTRVSFRPMAMRLPPGQSEVVAYIVSGGGEWREIGRLPLNVRTRIGLDEGRVVPSADLSSSGQLDRSVTDGAPPQAPRTYQDLTLRMGIEGTFGRDAWRLTTRGNALGVTKEEQRLRFGELDDDAPAIDLSDYRVELARRQATLSLGNLSVGSNRYLISGFGSRGVSGGIRLGDIAALEAAVVNGTNVVGWSNPLGLQQPSHRMSSLTLALELVPSRPGAVQIDVSGFDGSVLPFSSFNQGAATDAEESRGVGVQVALSDPSQRARLAGGFSRSRFDNPTDPFLAADTTVVPVVATTRMARYGELGVQLLQGWSMTPSIPVSLATTVRHERVDPLYRSVGAYVQSDIENNGADLTGALGPLSFQTSISRSRDNLADIASILTTRTRNRSLNGALPLGALVGAGPEAWYLPNVSASWQRVHQFGEGVPEDGGFAESHVPDQASTNQTVRLNWMGSMWNLSYAWNRSHQDNRQPEREQADFRTTVHAVTLGVTPASFISTSLDVSVERQKNYELDNTQRLERLGGSTQLQVTRSTAISSSVSQSWGFDPFAEQRTRNTEFNVELSQGFTVYGRHDGGTQGRVFVRYARTRAVFRPFEPVSLVDPFLTWTLNAGASFRLY